MEVGRIKGSAQEHINRKPDPDDAALKAKSKRAIAAMKAAFASRYDYSELRDQILAHQRSQALWLERVSSGNGNTAKPSQKRNGKASKR